MVSTTTSRRTNWAIEVASRMKGARFPLAKQEAMRRLRGVVVGDTHMEALLEYVDFPIASPVDLLKEIKGQMTNVQPDREEWAIEAAKALEGSSYPLTREEAKERLRGIVVRGTELSSLVDKLCFPCSGPAVLIDQIEDNLN